MCFCLAKPLIITARKRVIRCLLFKVIYFLIDESSLLIPQSFNRIFIGCPECYPGSGKQGRGKNNNSSHRNDPPTELYPAGKVPQP